MELIRHAASVSEKRDSLFIMIACYCMLALFVLLYSIIANNVVEEKQDEIYSISYEPINFKPIQEHEKEEEDIPSPPPLPQTAERLPIIVDSISAVEKDSVIKEEIVDIIENISNTETEHVGEGNDPQGNNPEGIITENVDDEGGDQIFIYVANMPEFPGGLQALRKWIAEHIIYPPVAKENGIEGIVYLKFEVTKTGSIGKVEIQKGADPLLNEEAVRVIKQLPAFKPGEHNGKKVNVWYSIPVSFKLN